MVALKERVAALYVDRATQKWVVRDREGNLWTLSPGENAWEDRLPFELIDENELEILPVHYIFMLGLHK
jgi:hypothetical protein